MKKYLKLKPKQINPEKREVLKSMGYSSKDNPSPKVNSILDNAYRLFLELSKPEGLISHISISDFKDIYKGEGKNEADTPLKHIYPKAEHLALFVFTLGKKISNKINNLFEEKDFTIATLLDSIASLSADEASAYAEKYFLDYLKSEKNVSNSTAVLLYSPGYCGWHISGQKKLFQHIKPEKIGIYLNKSFLMIPLKSISGVLVAGNKKIHFFKNNFPFCKKCKDKTCIKRMLSLKRKD